MFGLDPFHFWIVIAVTLFSGFVKGAVGFAMPMIMMSALGSFLTAQQALAILILPTLFTNIGQAFRQGWRPAWDSTVKYRWHIGMVALSGRGRIPAGGFPGRFHDTDRRASPFLEPRARGLWLDAGG